MVGMKLVKEGQADAFVSAGSSGAVLVGGQVIVGRIKGVERPPLAPLIPTEKGVSLLVDCGANVDARPSHLVQFAKMGSIYMEHVVGIKNPKVGIVNIGAEEEKGNALVKETFPLLKGEKNINFIGSVEAREIPHGQADVIVCEAFAGNIILKLYRRCRKCAYFRDQERHDGKLKKQDRCASCKTGTEEDVEELLTRPSTEERRFWDSTVSLSRHTAALLRRKSAIRLYSVLHLKNRRSMRRSKKVFSRSNFRWIDRRAERMNRYGI